MKRKILLSLAAFALAFMGKAEALPATQKMGIVNFNTCVMESKYGKREQKYVEAIRKQLVSLIESADKELREISKKLEDPEYLDSLSEKAEEDLKLKAQSLQEDMMRFQNQFYQIMNQANMQSIQRLNGNIQIASEQFAKERKLNYVINRDACFFYETDLEVTESIIDLMNKNFDADVKEGRLSENVPEKPLDVKTDLKANPA